MRQFAFRDVNEEKNTRPSPRRHDAIEPIRGGTGRMDGCILWQQKRNSERVRTNRLSLFLICCCCCWKGRVAMKRWNESKSRGLTTTNNAQRIAGTTTQPNYWRREKCRISPGEYRWIFCRWWRKCCCYCRNENITHGMAFANGGNDKRASLATAAHTIWNTCSSGKHFSWALGPSEDYLARLGQR